MTARIVLATRFGDESAEPARVATRLARQMGADIFVAYVAVELEAAVAGAAQAGVDPGAERERQLRHLDEELGPFIEQHFTGLNVEVRILEGDVPEALSRLALEVQADFIIVGTRGRSGIARLILGDTTQSILQRTPCPVVVVPLRLHSG